MTDNKEFDNLRTLHAATTPGDWAVLPPDHHESWPGVVEADGGKWIVSDWGAWMGQEQMGADAAFIVAAHNELPALLARLDEVTAERDALAAVIDAIRQNWRTQRPGFFHAHTKQIIDNMEPSSVLAAHDAKVRAEALRDYAEALSANLHSEAWGKAEFVADVRDWADTREENR